MVTNSPTRGSSRTSRPARARRQPHRRAARARAAPPRRRAGRGTLCNCLSGTQALQARPKARLHTKEEGRDLACTRSYANCHWHLHAHDRYEGAALQGAAPAPSKRKRGAPALSASWIVWIWLDTTLSTSASMRLRSAPHRVVHHTDAWSARSYRQCSAMQHGSGAGADLNSSKQPHAPHWTRPLKMEPMAL